MCAQHCFHVTVLVVEKMYVGANCASSLDHPRFPNSLLVNLLPFDHASDHPSGVLVRLKLILTKMSLLEKLVPLHC